MGSWRLITGGERGIIKDAISEIKFRTSSDFEGEYISFLQVIKSGLIASYSSVWLICFAIIALIWFGFTIRNKAFNLCDAVVCLL